MTMAKAINEGLRASLQGDAKVILMGEDIGKLGGVFRVTEGLQAFMRDLKAQGAIINFEVYPDPELNTASQLEQGRVYWNIRFTDVPPAENPTFRVEVTNQWITEVLDI